MNNELTTKKCSLLIDGEKFDFEVQGVFFTSKDGILFSKKNSVIENVDWFTDGYTKLNAFSENEFKNLNESITKNILKGLENAGIAVEKDKFNLQDYHHYATNDDIHFKVINHTRNLRNEDFNLDFSKLEKIFSNHLGVALTSKIKDLGRSHIQIRISRPNSLDINPPHRDGYLDYWKNILNIWVPISGCNDKSSLPLVPGSHLLPENKIIRTEARSAYINGNVYVVPCILETTDGPFEMIRPNPKPGEALLFTPYLIHGAGINLNPDITRISLELRFDQLKI